MDCLLHLHYSAGLALSVSHIFGSRKRDDGWKNFEVIRIGATGGALVAMHLIKYFFYTVYRNPYIL